MTDEQNQTRKIHPEMLVGLSAVVIGICALGVSFYEAGLMRKEQRAGVIPLLELSRSYYWEAEEERSRLLLQAENVGIGPALIRDFHVTVDGKPFQSWNAAIRELIGHEASISYGQSTINGRTIPPQRLVTMMSLNDSELTPRILEEFGRLDFEACFCSVFDECWTTSYSTFGAAFPVEACHRSDSSFNE